jgi:hypothetical protein
MDSDIEVGLTSWALWSAANRRWRSRSVVVLVAAFLAAVALHATWDYVNTLVSSVLIGVASLSLLSAAARGAAAENVHRNESDRTSRPYRPGSPCPGSPRRRGRTADLVTASLTEEEGQNLSEGP